MGKKQVSELSSDFEALWVHSFAQKEIDIRSALSRDLNAMDSEAANKGIVGGPINVEKADKAYKAHNELVSLVSDEFIATCISKGILPTEYLMRTQLAAIMNNVTGRLRALLEQSMLDYGGNQKTMLIGNFDASSKLTIDNCLRSKLTHFIERVKSEEREQWAKDKRTVFISVASSVATALLIALGTWLFHSINPTPSPTAQASPTAVPSHAYPRPHLKYPI